MEQRKDQGRTNEMTLGQLSATHAGGSFPTEIKDERLGARRSDGRTENILVALKKTEKLTMALYMVTDVLPDREPLKWQLREGATKLLSEVALTATAGASDKFFLWGRAETRIDEITALLDIAGITKMMSEMNAAVLKKEYQGLKYQIAVERESVGGHGGVTLSDEFFSTEEHAPTFTLPAAPEEAPAPVVLPEVLLDKKDTLVVTPVVYVPESVASAPVAVEAPVAPIVPTPEPVLEAVVTAPATVPSVEEKPLYIRRETLPVAQSVIPTPVTKKEEVDEVEASDIKDIPVRQTGEVSMKDLPVVARPLASVIRPTHHVTPRVSETLQQGSHDSRLPSSSRRQVILDVLKQKPDLSVRDLVDKIEGFSEKTIQRELLSMVADGVLRKQGERRWSRYSLAR